MFVRSKEIALMLILVVFLQPFHALAQTRCGADVNNDGDIDDVGEYESCISTSNDAAPHAVSYQCDLGFTLQGTICEKRVVLSEPALSTGTCESGWEEDPLNTTQCRQGTVETKDPYVTVNVCPPFFPGWTNYSTLLQVDGSVCRYRLTPPTSATPPYDDSTFATLMSSKYSCPSMNTCRTSTNVFTAEPCDTGFTYTGGGQFSPNTCTRNVYQYKSKDATYFCKDSTWILNGTTCEKEEVTQVPARSTISCEPGYVDIGGNCQKPVNNAYCPIGTTDCVTETKEICPFGENIPCNNGSCTTTQSDSCKYISGDQYSTTYQCPIDGKYFTNYSSEGAGRECHSHCTGAKTMSCSQVPSDYSCPLGDGFACKNVPGFSQPQCTKNSCFDISASGVQETVKVDTSMYTNDGPRDVNGVCEGQTRIFSGRPMTCRLPGASSAWKNCCTNNKGKVYHDSQGNVVESALTNKAITATAAAAWAAGSTYAAAVSSGASGAQAAEAGGQAFMESMQGAFDPTSLVVALVIALVMEWLANACDQGSLETAALRASGYCIRIGTICTHRFLGSCTQKEEVNCCYNSMLARIVNEQGLPQLVGYEPIEEQELSSGTLAKLDCGGFTPEQFQSLDFQGMDFSEYHEEINKGVTDRLNTEGDAAIQRFENENLPE